MRIALVLAVVVSGLALAGCGSTCGSCNNSCAPKMEQCCTWQPDCCVSWDFYDPCDLIEGREYRKAPACEQVPTCPPCK